MKGIKHIQYLIAKCSKLVNVIKSLRGTWWEANPSTLLSVYKALIRGSVEYASFLFPVFNKTLSEKLDQVQRRALRLCIGARRITPINVLYAETSISPLKQRVIFLISKFILKSFAVLSNPLMDKLNELQDIIYRYNNRFHVVDKFLLYKSFLIVKKHKPLLATFSKIPLFLFSYETSAFMPSFNVTPSVKKNSLISDPQKIFDLFSVNLHEHVHFFTDASKSESSERVGVAFTCPSLMIEEMYKTERKCSVFSGECLALIYAVDFILEHSIVKSAVFSDSRSVLDLLSSKKLNRDCNYLILVLKNKLRSASLQGIDIILSWIPAHMGILGNKNVDALAKRAVREGSLSEYHTPHTDFYSSVREYYLLSTRKCLLSQAKVKGSQYFCLYPDFPSRLWYAGIDFERETIIALIRIRSNHYNLNYSLHRCNIVESPACECGAPSQDINHVLWDRVLYREHRPSLLRSRRDKVESPPPYCIFELPKSPLQVISSISSFLRRCDLAV